jgi:cytochrome c oxidase subunit 2
MIRKWPKRLMAAAAMAPALAIANQYTLPLRQSIIAREIGDLHTLILVICCVIFMAVFGTMFYAIIMHRKAVGHQGRQFHDSSAVEIAWTIVPFLILIGAAYPAAKTSIAMKDASRPDLTIRATGYQWKWGYAYLQEGISYDSSLATPRDQIEGSAPNGVSDLLEVDNPLVVPVGKKVRIIMIANDVIHSWWVPPPGVKQDAIPGFVRDSWFKVDKPGTYRGKCAESCGKDHGYIPMVVEAVEPEKYALWIAEQQEKMVAHAVDTGRGDGPRPR